jgi:DNA-directed RNA polymerase specialized sigma24 family protein
MAVCCCSISHHDNGPLSLLVDLFGYSSEQAARILKVRPSIVRNLASQARRTLRASEVARDA